MKSRLLRWGLHGTGMEECRNTYRGPRDLFGRPEGKKTIGRPMRRWEDNIKIDSKEVICETGN